MTDFLAFASGGSAPAGGDIDFDRAAAAFPDISIDGSDDFHTPAPSQAPSLARNDSAGFSFDAFDSPPAQRAMDIKVTGDDDIENFENEFPDIGVSQQTFSPPSLAPTLGATTTFAPRPVFTSTPILTQPLDEEEPQVIKDWREKQAAEIIARDEASKAKRQEAIARAERSIDAFYEEYTKKKEKNIRENKEAEAEYLASLSSALSTGTTWERIADLIELQNSQSKTLSRTGAGTSDLARFKEVLLRLKREGPSAPGAAGY